MIKENQIPQEVSTDPDVLKDMFVRFVTAMGTGMSKNKKVSEFILKIANIYGLQTALDSKITKNVAGLEGSIPTYLADGDIDFSTFKIGSFDSAASIGSLTDNGFYTAEGSGSGYENSIMGYLAAVLTINDTQIVLSTDRGLWYRTYSGGWSIPSYIGGSVNNITVSRTQADWLVANNSLTVGAVYRIFDHPDYMYMVLTAATSSTFFEDGLAYAACPIHRNAGTYTIGGESVVFKGCWEFLTDADIDTGNVVWYCNRLYASATGNKGTATDWVLDSTNWSLINYRVNPEFYAFEWHTIEYDYANDYVKKEADNLGNEFGEPIEPSDGFRTCFNDWNRGIDDILGANNSFYGNRLKRVYSVYVLSGEPTIINCIGDGEIRGAFAASSIVFERIRINGENAYLTIPNATDVAIYNTDVLVPLDDDVEYLKNCVVAGQMNGCTGIMAENTIFHDASQINGWDFNGYTLRNSEIYGTNGAITLNWDTELRQSKGSIFASLYIGGGEFSYAQGGTFQKPTYGSGCEVNIVASNGVTITGSDISTLAITIVHAGYYNFKYDTSARSATKIDVEVKAFKGAAAIPMLYEKGTYVAIDEWRNSSISGIVQLLAGEVITVKYASPGSGTTTLLTGQINLTIEYKGQ